MVSLGLLGGCGLVGWVSGNFKYFLECSPRKTWGRFSAILTSIFFKGVETQPPTSWLNRHQEKKHRVEQDKVTAAQEIFVGRSWSRKGLDSPGPGSDFT